VEITPDQIVYWRAGPIALNATLVWTWVTMVLMAVGCWLVTRRLSSGPPTSRAQNFLEVLIAYMRQQIREISQDEPDRYLVFVGSLFLFIAASTVLGMVPGYRPPIGSLSTTAALAICVFVAVPVYGISRQGVRKYLKHFVQPNPIMLPFNVIGELSRTLALAVRLFGNVMSGSLIVAILIGLVPLFFPIVMQAFGLLIGMIQAYIFAVLAMVYIASGARVSKQTPEADSPHSTEGA